MPTIADSTVERPLNGATRLALIVTTAATIGLFYLFIFLAILGLLVWIGFFILLVIGLARFGLAGFIVKFLERDARVLGLLVRSLWLREGAVYRLPLQRTDAPELFAMLERLAKRLEIPVPDELCLEMSGGAWVELRGLKTGIGTTRVGVGYDLLAALGKEEVEAVMAHELAHAKLIGRFFNNWLSRGLGRAVTVSNQLSSLAHAYRRANETFGPGDWILAGADGLTRWCARQMGAYFRQGEFEADRGSAQLCGPAALRSALQRLHDVQPILARLPWNERVAQIESPDGLSRRLLRDLAEPAPVTEETLATVDRYSTHPSLRDRLAALGGDGTRVIATSSGLDLLSEPDKIALKLVGAIEETLLKREQEDLRELQKWLRKIRRTRNYRLAQAPGMLTVFAGVVSCFWSLGESQWLVAVLAPLTIIPLGIWFVRLGRYRDRRELIVPDYAAFMMARPTARPADVAGREKEIEGRLRTLIAQVAPKKKVVRLVEEAYSALGQCDYLQAHVASRIAAEFSKESEERALAMIVAAAAFDQGDTVNGLFQFLVKRTSFRSPSSSWAAAWALMLIGDWWHAEAMLNETLRTRPNDANLISMLALCQGNRGKLQSAIGHIRQVCRSETSPSVEHLKLFVRLLLDRGALRDAGVELEKLGEVFDPEVIYLRIRFHLLRREFTAAEKQLARLDPEKTTGQQLFAVGLLYENARADEAALKCFEQALARGHYPAVRLALARHASKAKETAKAREHIHAALDITKTLGENAASAFAVFPDALALLLSLEEANHNCRAWITSVLPGKEAGPLNKRSLVVYAPTENDAATHLQNLLRAMKPDLPLVASSSMNIKPAPRDMQPSRAVRPGVQYVFQ